MVQATLNFWNSFLPYIIIVQHSVKDVTVVTIIFSWLFKSHMNWTQKGSTVEEGDGCVGGRDRVLIDAKHRFHWDKCSTTYEK